MCEGEAMRAAGIGKFGLCRHILASKSLNGPNMRRNDGRQGDSEWKVGVIYKKIPKKRLRSSEYNLTTISSTIRLRSSLPVR